MLRPGVEAGEEKDVEAREEKRRVVILRFDSYTNTILPLTVSTSKSIPTSTFTSLRYRVHSWPFPTAVLVSAELGFTQLHDR
jgi:hypothetical protein